MDIDENKKRKVEENTPLDLESVIKAHLESTQDMAKLIVLLTQKVVNIERVLISKP